MPPVDEGVTAAVDDFLTRFGVDGRRVLDVACGSGGLLDHLERHHRGFLSYLGVDSADAVARARAAHPDAHRDFAVRDVVARPFPPGAFDLVVARGDDAPPLAALTAMAAVAALRVGADGEAETAATRRS